MANLLASVVTPPYGIDDLPLVHDQRNAAPRHENLQDIDLTRLLHCGRPFKTKVTERAAMHLGVRAMPLEA
jgi:hypothetical protein